MATRNNTTALVRGAVFIAFLVYLPFWFGKRFPPKPETDKYSLGTEATTPGPDTRNDAANPSDIVDPSEDPRINNDYSVLDLRARIEASQDSAETSSLETQLRDRIKAIQSGKATVDQ